MSKQSGQKFLAKTRAPRVQIEYDVEVNGAAKKVELPFVFGVMSDLSGQNAEPKAPVVERSFAQFDSENFDDRMKAIAPRVAAVVPNALTGEGNLSVDLTFESMDDFEPAAIARKIEPLRRLLEARSQLQNLLTYMDGKVGAEELIEKLLADPELMRSLAGPASAEPDGGAAAGTDAQSDA